MLAEITQSKAQQLTSPNAFCLVSSADEAGKTNLAAISWWTYCSNRPATIAVCMSQKGYSGELIKAGRVFGLSVVGAGMEESAYACGTCSGRTVDKAKEFGIELVDAGSMPLKLVKNSRVAFACRVVNIVTVGDHDMFIGEVQAVQGDESVQALYATNGYGKLSTVSLP